MKNLILFAALLLSTNFISAQDNTLWVSYGTGSTNQLSFTAGVVSGQILEELFTYESTALVSH